MEGWTGGSADRRVLPPRRFYFIVYTLYFMGGADRRVLPPQRAHCTSTVFLVIEGHDDSSDAVAFLVDESLGSHEQRSEATQGGGAGRRRREERSGTLLISESVHQPSREECWGHSSN